jgi:hypothetical protein
MDLSWRAVFPEETTNSRHAKVHHPSQATLFWTFLNFFQKKALPLPKLAKTNAINDSARNHLNFWGRSCLPPR